jgi:hypothetical protein
MSTLPHRSIARSALDTTTAAHPQAVRLVRGVSLAWGFVACEGVRAGDSASLSWSELDLQREGSRALRSACANVDELAGKRHLNRRLTVRAQRPRGKGRAR